MIAGAEYHAGHPTRVRANAGRIQEMVFKVFQIKVIQRSVSERTILKTQVGCRIEIVRRSRAHEIERDRHIVIAGKLRIASRQTENVAAGRAETRRGGHAGRIRKSHAARSADFAPRNRKSASRWKSIVSRAALKAGRARVNTLIGAGIHDRRLICCCHRDDGLIAARELRVRRRQTKDVSSGRAEGCSSYGDGRVRKRDRSRSADRAPKSGHTTAQR